MLNEIIKTAEELNTAALIYRLRKESLRMRLKNCVQKCLP